MSAELGSFAHGEEMGYGDGYTGRGADMTIYNEDSEEGRGYKAGYTMGVQDDEERS